ncbi:hypothetical protein J6590_012960 [Homalodisca vitripennis]|nr:hypothetical protein J6590_012960 [Homalodisca vitripennis]
MLGPSHGDIIINYIGGDWSDDWSDGDVIAGRRCPDIDCAVIDSAGILYYRWSKRGASGPQSFLVPDDDDDDPGPGKRSAGWLWRVIRAALPFQMAILAIFCVACLLEPHCCDNINNLNFSLTPQLRYVRGPPPT